MKRIVVIQPDGSETELDRMPNLKEMQKIVGGMIEHVSVMDRRDEGGNIVYTSMYINEEGLLEGLERNPKATEIYQRNIRAAYPDSPNPFKDAEDEFRKKAEAGGFAFIDARPDEFDPHDPHIVGPAIYFEGYTLDEVNDAYEELRDEQE